MKHLVQAFLIGGGIIGLIPSAPIAFYAWRVHRAFSGDLTTQDRMLLAAPFVCGAALVVGVIWRKLDRAEEPGPNL